MTEPDAKVQNVAKTLIGAKRLVEAEVGDIGFDQDSPLPRLLKDLITNVLRPHLIATRDGRSLRDQRQSMVRMVRKAFAETDPQVLGNYQEHKNILVGFCIETLDKVIEGQHKKYLDS